MTAPEEKTDLFAVKVRLNDDGTLFGGGGKYELFAVLLADGFEKGDAWVGAGYSMEPGSIKMRSRLQKAPEFQVRVLQLKNQKRDLAALLGTPEISEEHSLLKETRWLALQTYRQAQLKGDIKIMSDMTQLMLKLGSKNQAAIVAAPAAANEIDDDAPARGPGRPPVSPPERDDKVEALRQRLAEKGLAAPGQA
jgi:hypothetical protein